MNSQVIVPIERIDEDDLEELVKRITELTEADITVRRQFVVTSDSPAVLNALQVLLVEPGNSKTRANGHKKTAKKRKVAAMKPRSWKNVLTGEILSARALKGLMAQGLVSEQTAYENSRGEVFVVIGGELVKEPQGEKA